MSKQVIVLAPNIHPDRPRRKFLPILSLFVTVPLLAPIVLDAASLCYGQWCELLGSPVDIRTPTLDAISERVAEVREEVKYHISSRFHRVPWNPRVVLMIAFAVMLVAIIMLRL